MIKVCTKCSKRLNIDFFYKDGKSKDGYSYWCNKCRKENVKRHRENPAYRKRQMEWNNKWRIRPENREKILQIRLKSQKKIYKALKIAGFVTEEKRQEIYTRDGSKCMACETRRSLTIDHIKSVQKGGRTINSNLQTLCQSCNSKKQQRTINYMKKGR